MNFSDSGLRKSVRTGPGSMMVTWMPNGSRSCASDSEKPSTANLVDEYTPKPTAER